MKPLRIINAHAVTRRLVEVEANGPRGQEHHYALYYERGNGDLKLVVESGPGIERALQPDNPLVRPEVIQAGLRALREAA